MITLIIDVVRTVISWIDKMVYTFLEFLISTFDALANVELFSEGFLEKMADRLFFLVSIIMIFKVSFSIIQYIINPDDFSNNEKGMGKIVQSIILVLVGLVAVRPIFNGAINIQKRIMDEQIIESLVLGLSDRLGDANEQKDLKSKIPFSVLKSFVTPNHLQIPGVMRNKDGVYQCNGPMYKISATGAYEYQTSFGNCLAAKSENKVHNYSGSSGNSQGSFADLYNAAHTKNDFGLLLDLVNDKSSSNADVYVLKYDMLISTAVGVFMVILYFNFCLDLAIRAAKFGFLQLIAPIPIISMIDPKSSKSGMMSKWLTNCINTYAGLFLRIAAVSFSVLIVDLVFNEKIISGIQTADTLIQVVIIIGAFLFAKELPKLISEMTGINFGGDFKLNPLQRVPGGKAATKLALGTGAALGTVAGAGASALGRGAVGALAAPLHNIPAIRNRFGSPTMQLRRTANSMGSTFLSGASRAGNTMLESLPFKVPKGSGNKDRNQEFDKVYEEQISRNRGAKLNQRIEAVEAAAPDEETRKNAKYTIYKNEAFGQAVKSMDQAKTNMYAAENYYEHLLRRAANGEDIAAADIDDAKKKSFSAKTAYEGLKADVERLGNRYGSDYRRYQDYKAYDDYRKAIESSTGTNNPPPTYDPLNHGGNNGSGSNQNQGGNNGSGSNQNQGGNNGPGSNQNQGGNNGPGSNQNQGGNNGPGSNQNQGGNNGPGSNQNQGGNNNGGNNA